MELDKKVHGISAFYAGARIAQYQDKLYITGGKDYQGDKKTCLAYGIKDGKIYKIPDMNNARSYHTMLFHENLKSLVVFGGENNNTCEMFDFYLNTWNALPDLNVPRANLSAFIDRIGTFAFTVCGITGNITSGAYSDAIELLDLVDMSQGWIRIDYKNKANVDLKENDIKIYPLSDNNLLIYGASESRIYKKCFVIFDLKKFEIKKIDSHILEMIKVNCMLHPELSKIFK